METTDEKKGILMPTIDSFYEKTALALSVQPQKGRYFFLPGKGWGTEIAIRGDIVGRTKHNKYLHAIPYRSHSDFELYGVPNNFAYTQAFHDAFGSQEYFGETQTKMFGRKENNTSPIPRGYIKENSEITVLDGANIQTLNLEMLIADKLISEKFQFNKPNNHGRDISDSACLALLYDVDIDKVKNIINDFYIKPEREYAASKVSDEALLKRAQNLIRKINSVKDNDAEDRCYYSISLYAPVFSEKDLHDLYEDESKWENGKLKEQEAIKIIHADYKKFKSDNDTELNNLSQENIFKKIDAFFLAVQTRRKELDIEMAATSKSILNQKDCGKNK